MNAIHRPPTVQNSLHAGWRELNKLSRGEYGVSLVSILRDRDPSLSFRRIGRLVAVSIKYPFAQSFPYDPDSPSNWARSRRCWEIRGPVPAKTIRTNQIQADLLAQIAADWERPIELIAEFNIFHSLCGQLRSVICGEAKGVENAEKIGKELQKAGTDATVLSPNQLLGAASVTIAAYLVQSIPILSGSSPLVTGATLMAVCFGQRRLCKLLTKFQKSYDPRKDRFANRDFPICGSLATSGKQPCSNRVRHAGDNCWIHAYKRRKNA